MLVLSTIPTAVADASAPADPTVAASMIKAATDEGTCSSPVALTAVVSTVNDGVGAVYDPTGSDCEFRRTVVDLAPDGGWEVLGGVEDRQSCLFGSVEPDIAADLDLCQSSVSCTTMRSTASTKAAIGAAARKLLRISGTVKRVKLGRCGRQQYALATISYPLVGTTTDQPSFLHRTSGKPWKMAGEAGGDPLCHLAETHQIPWPMSDAWLIDPSPCYGNIAPTL